MIDDSRNFIIRTELQKIYLKLIALRDIDRKNTVRQADLF